MSHKHYYFINQTKTKINFLWLYGKNLEKTFVNKLYLITFIFTP